ncbi:MAG: cytidine deaminase [Pirellulales bacterium]|jgi:cytidine deaminase|nr:cytidine deaminase [Pirellulales bacterium]HJN67647.1 cytidine deaminase [Pirellulales bacterium]|tara:strand:+ start:1111 stop:1500 length:390 start_codon:yes stop_codon:yes gene_type:complete
MNEQQKTELVAAALEARLMAHAPYSRFFVGAALLSTDGTIFRGANVENASYGLTICAERTALGAAVTAGHQTFSGIAIAAAGGVSPCGACRQVLAEFATQLPVVLVDTESNNAIREVDLAALLPDPFSS